MMQMIFTIFVLCAMMISWGYVLKKKDKSTYVVEGMMSGFVVGAIAGYYILNALICAPIGMALGIIIGKTYQK